jgi:hypothetical protein
MFHYLFNPQVVLPSEESFIYNELPLYYSAKGHELSMSKKMLQMGNKLTPWSKVLLQNLMSAGQEIPHFMETMTMTKKRLPLDPILHQFNPIHTLTPYFFKIH